MTDIDALLRRYDAEPDAGLTPAEADHSEWLLAQITSIPSTQGAVARRAAFRRLARPRLALGIAASAAAVGAAAIAATGLAAVAVLTSGQSSSPPPGARLAAWTVTTEANGAVDVTIRQLTDAEGLQRTLRADGIPARVLFGTIVILPGGGDDPAAITGGGPSHPVAHPGRWQEVDPSVTVSPLPPGCEPAGPVSALESGDALAKIVGTPQDWLREGVALTLHPASIPPGVGLYLAVDIESSRQDWTWSMYPVKASPACTGA